MPTSSNAAVPAELSLAFLDDAQCPVRRDDGGNMTIRRIKTIAFLTPLGAILALEITRTFLFHSVSWRQRLTLDAVALLALSLFSLSIFRFVDEVQNRLRRQNRELLALHSAGLDVTADLSLDTVLKKVVDHARLLVGAKYGALSVIDENGGIETFLTSGITPEGRAAIGPPPRGHGVLGVVLREGHRLRLDRIQDHPRSVGFPPNHPEMKSLLAVPVACKSPFRGNLYLADKETPDGTFSEDDEQTLERFALQAALAIDNAYLHSQTAALAIAQERIRIAHEMHDGLAQVLGYVNTKVQAADAYLARGKTSEASQQLQELAVSARSAYTDVRESIIGLRTLPEEGRSLADALQEFLVHWKEQSGIETEVDIDDDLRLRPNVELQLIRIVQEALTNVRKHSKAKNARVHIRREGAALSATIADDGIGFTMGSTRSSEFPRFGLTTMRERAESIGGTLSIDSTPEKGTTVTFSIPAATAME